LTRQPPPPVVNCAISNPPPMHTEAILTLSFFDMSLGGRR
jgi:hypothetical protein